MTDRFFLRSARAASLLVLTSFAVAAYGQSTPQAQPDPQATQPIQNLPQSSAQDRAQVLRDAQARVEMRRRQRQQLIIEDTYSHKYEVFFGGGYLRFRPGAYLQHMNETAFDIGATEWIRPKLGITGDVRGYYGTVFAGINQVQIFKPSISEYTFMAGPQYRAYQTQKLAVGAQVLAGVGHGNFTSGSGGFPASIIGVWPDGNSFNVSVGAPVDYNLSPALAVRLMPNYLLTDYGSTLQHNLGFTLGVMYRFGRR